MNDFSIELNAERIPDARTRKYFSEVLATYSTGSYRSAVVMLWSVCICDMFFKLKQLADHFGDTVAQSVITEIETIRVANPNSPEWEWRLVELVKARTKLLEAGDYANLEALIKHRHLSAHPVLSASEILFEPTRESVRAHIRNALEGVLTKPVMMTKKIFDAFVEDLESSAPSLPDDSALGKYLSAKYLSHLVPAIESTIFRSLWRLVFRVDVPRAETNRVTNFRALSILYSKRSSAIQEEITGERHYFSDVGVTGSRFDLLFRFVGMHPELYSILTDAAKAHLETHGKRNLDNYSRALFLSPDIGRHFDVIEHNIVNDGRTLSGEAFEELFKRASGVGAEDRALDVAVSQFAHSSSYNNADSSFLELIKPYLERFSQRQLTNIVRAANENGQIYARGRAASHHRIIKDAVDRAFSGGFDFALYPRFSESIGLPAP